MTADSSWIDRKLLGQPAPGNWPDSPGSLVNSLVIDTEYPCGCKVGIHGHGAFAIRCDQHQTIPVRHANAARLAELCKALDEPLETPPDHRMEPPYRMTWERALSIAAGRTAAWRQLLEHMQVADPDWLNRWRSGLAHGNSDEHR